MSKDIKTVFDHQGKEFATITEMCNFYNISRSAFNHRIARGSSLEEALTTPVGKKTKHNLKSPEERKKYNHARRVAYYHAHRDKALADSKAYYHVHHEECLAYQAEYRLKHNDYYRGYQAAKRRYMKGCAEGE